MLLVMQPFSTGLQKSHIFGLINAVCAALAFTSIRELRRYYDTRTIVFYFMGIGLMVSIISMFSSEYYSSDFFAFMMGKFTMPQGVDWLYLVGIGVFSAIGQIYMTKAYGVTKAGIVGAAGYSVILFSIVIGLVLGEALPNSISIIGIVGIISAGVLIASEKSEKKED
jgi:drug/metabolite transporter (DMT)-like permease